MGKNKNKVIFMNNLMAHINSNTPQELISKRFEMIQAKEKGEKIDTILTKYGVSRPVFYKFFNRYTEIGLNGLYDLSKAPHNHGLKIDLKDEKKIVGLFHMHPYFSSYEMNELVHINPKTIQRVYKRNHLVKIYKPKREKKHLLEQLKKESRKSKMRR